MRVESITFKLIKVRISMKDLNREFIKFTKIFHCKHFLEFLEL